MERDFLGLSSKESVPMAKEEITNYWCKDSGFTKDSAVKWPFSNQVSAKMTSPGLSAIPSGALQNMMNGANVKQPPLSGLPVTMLHSILPIVSAVAGSTETCVKPSTPAPQLTMFYAGTVNVFTAITPEKAQAIMLLAGNGLFAASNTTQPDVEACVAKFSILDGVPMSPPIDIPPCSGITTPLFASSYTGAQFGSGSSSSDEFLGPKISGGPITSVSKVNSPKEVNASTMYQFGIPQARKASLARFLEKRKERVMNTAPYNCNKKSEVAHLVNSKDAII